MPNGDLRAYLEKDYPSNAILIRLRYARCRLDKFLSPHYSASLRGISYGIYGHSLPERFGAALFDSSNYICFPGQRASDHDSPRFKIGWQTRLAAFYNL